jgi:predicted TIM-barrel fold metal-dependent hydrolase
MTDIDCHYHVDESIVSLPGLIASMDAAGIDKIALIAGMNDDLAETTLVRYGLPLLLKALSGRSRLFRMAMLKMYENVVKGDGTVDTGGIRYEVKAQPRNDEVLSALDRYPDRFSGWVFVNPAGPLDPVLELERCFRHQGMIGVKAHPYWHDYEVSLLRDVAALCQERDKPMLIHLGTDKKGDFKELPESFSRLKVIYAHAGVPYYNEVCEYSGEKENVYVDLAGGYVDLKVAGMAIRKAGAHKCLFGTDGPYFHHGNDRFDYRRHIEKINELNLSDRDRERVMGGTFKELAGID